MYSSLFKSLTYIPTVLLFLSLTVLVYFAADLQKFEEKCKSQMILFQTLEQAAWKDIIELEKIHIRSKRQTENSIPKKQKTRKSKLRKGKKPPKRPHLYQKQLVSVAEELSEIEGYKNSEWKKEFESDSENELETEITTASNPEDTENPDDVVSEEKDPEEKEGDSEDGDKQETPENSTEPTAEVVRNMSTREMKYGMNEGRLAQLLEIDDDGNEEEEEKEEDDYEEEDVEGEGGGEFNEYKKGEERNENEEECADTDTKCYGNPCPRGPPGPPGLPGSPGEDAPDGVDGGNGTEWELHAEDRVIILGCVKCPQGPRGIEGDPGPPGDKGGIGKNGNPGLDGYEGFPGQTGQEGESGYDGDYGPDGWPGQRGEDSKIYRNLPGPPGPPGVVGPPGEYGGYGHLGNAGTEGIAGVAGAPGHHGIHGPPGAPGAPGEPGISGGYVGQCKCPERRRPVGRGGGYPLPSQSYYPTSQSVNLPYITSTIGYYPSFSSSLEYPPEPPTYVETTSEAPTTSIYRYFVKTSAPGYKTLSTESEYVDSTNRKPSEYSVEKENQYVERFIQEASNHLSESGIFDPPVDHLPISIDEKT